MAAKSKPKRKPRRRRGTNAEGLNSRQAKFVEAYTGGGPKRCVGNGEQSAIWAGYARARARSTASRLLATNGNVQAAVARRQHKAAEKAQISREDLIRRLLEIADVDLRELLDDDGNLLPVSRWPESASRSLAGIETAELFVGRGESREQVGVVRKVKLEGRGQNLERVARLLGLLVERVGDPEGKPLAPGVIYLPRGARTAENEQ